jgi:hypothetical protein
MRLNNILDEVNTDYTPLTRDSEGNLHGGFGTIFVSESSVARLTNNCICNGNNCLCSGNNCDCKSGTQGGSPTNNCDCLKSTGLYSPFENNCDCGTTESRNTQLVALF